MSEDNDSQRLARLIISKEMVADFSAEKLEKWLSSMMVEISNKLGLQGLLVSGVVRVEAEVEDNLEVVAFYDFYGRPEQPMMLIPEGRKDPPSKPTLH